MCVAIQDFLNTAPVLQVTGTHGFLHRYETQLYLSQIYFKSEHVDNTLYEVMHKPSHQTSIIGVLIIPVP